MTAGLTAAERRALEWVRDQDERVAGPDPALVAALIRKEWIFDFRFRTPGGVGARSVLCALTPQGRAVLEAQPPG
jgi:hypothetical protein